MPREQLFPMRVHIISADAYVVGTLRLPRREGSRLPRFLDILNNPSVFIKSPGEITNDNALPLHQVIRHSFHGGNPRSYARLNLRLQAILFGSDEMQPGSTGIGAQKGLSGGDPEHVEIQLGGGLTLSGTVRGGCKTALFVRPKQPFFAATNISYQLPIGARETRRLSFVAVNSTTIECVALATDVRD